MSMCSKSVLSVQTQSSKNGLSPNHDCNTTSVFLVFVLSDLTLLLQLNYRRDTAA